MSAIGNITINDGLATPVAHVFTHASHSKDGVSYRDSTAGLTALVAPTIEVGRLPSRSKSIRRVRVKVAIPILETITGGTSEGYVAAPRKIGANEAIVDFIIHERSSEQAIKDIRAYMANAITVNNTQFYDLLLSDLAPY